MARDLLRNEHFEVEDDGHLVRARRTDAGFDSLAEVARVHAEIAELLEGLPRRRRRLYLDLRDAPSRNDEAFERALAPLRQRMLAEWERVAIVTRSVVGGLQVRRHAREDGLPVHVFSDPAQAEEYARRGVSERLDPRQRSR